MPAVQRKPHASWLRCGAAFRPLNYRVRSQSGHTFDLRRTTANSVDENTRTQNPGHESQKVKLRVYNGLRDADVGAMVGCLPARSRHASQQVNIAVSLSQTLLFGAVPPDEDSSTIKESTVPFLIAVRNKLAMAH